MREQLYASNGLQNSNLLRALFVLKNPSGKAGFLVANIWLLGKDNAVSVRGSQYITSSPWNFLPPPPVSDIDKPHEYWDGKD